MTILVQNGKLVIGVVGLGDMKLYEMFGNEELNTEELLAVNGPKKMIRSHDHKYEFDLAEDLVFYMHNNDDFYRRHFFPILKTCKAQFESGAKFSHRVFKPVIKKAYESYKQEFPVRELEEGIEEDLTEEIAKAIYETELQNLKDGLYK